MVNRMSLVLSAMLALCLSCSPSALQIQARIADGIGRAANAALPQLVQVEEQQGNEAIDRATTEAQANANLRQVVDQWRGFWAAWDVLRSAQGQWSLLITEQQAGHSIGVAEAVRIVGAIQSAWCTVRSAIPPPNTLPDIPLVNCPVSADAGVSNDE